MDQSRSAARVETVAPEHAGRRIDNFLMARLGDTPRSLVYKLLRSGQVRVNGGRVKPDYRLVAEDRVRIPPLAAPPPPGTPATIPPARVDDLDARVLHEDEDYLVLDKPAGMACHGGSGVRYGAIEIARRMRPGVARLDLAHRLDRDTSGCLLLTKHLAALRAFHDELRAGRVDKRYQALLRGRLPVDVERIRIALGTVRDAHGERASRAQADGKPAETRIVERRAVGADTLVEFSLVTGRMHQIRAHAQAIGHPLAGDPRYGDPAWNGMLAAAGLKRLFLHAARLAFTVHGRTLDVRAPLPPALAEWLARGEGSDV